MKIVAIIQARTGSSRLPSKVLKQICGQTVLGHVVDRVNSCCLLDEVVVATTTASEDDLIVKEADRLGAAVYRGSEENVLSRYYYAAQKSSADVVVRITSDCPFFDATLLTEMLAVFLKKNNSGRVVDYLSNTLDRTYPRGLDAEIFYFDVLERAFQNAVKDYEKEHVTPYVYEHPDLFVIAQHESDTFDCSDYRWTLDTVEDFKFIEIIYNALWEKNHVFQTIDIFRLIEKNPFLLNINSHIEQKKLGE